MRGRSPRQLAVVVALIAFGICGCGKGSTLQSSGAGPAQKLAPVAAQGAVSVVTRNTTRLGGGDVATDAAAVARAVYPALTAATRPEVVVLVNDHDWLPALVASVLSSAPTGAPILFSEGDNLPAVTRQTLEALHPLGAPALGGAQVIRIGTSAPVPDGYLTRTVSLGVPSDSAVSIEQLLVTLDHGSDPSQVILLAANDPEAIAMPAAGLAAESGAPILLLTRSRVPVATFNALARLHRPSLYVIDPSTLGASTIAELRHYGHVTYLTNARAPSAGDAAVQNAIEVARYTNGTFGWGVKEPGHGLVFANADRPFDAPASALLSATGDYGPLLLLASAHELSPALVDYLSDIQPAYTSAPEFQPVRGVYNHGWLIGDEQAVSAVIQAEIDTLLEISSRSQNSEESSDSQVE
jgi:hypothetical protein